ncbi:MAG: DUF89 family protein [Bacteroidetes bacterium]|nr:DUF89 family protein [Bacteroidota bacterium]
MVMITSTKHQNLRDTRCADCFRTGFARLMSRHALKDETVKSDLNNKLEQLIQENRLSSPALQKQLGQYFRQLTAIADPFSEEKRISNSLAETLYSEWKPSVQEASNPKSLALRLAIAGNIMDYGVNHHFDLEQTIAHVIQCDFAIDHSQRLLAALGAAKKVLYLCDNAGEIVMDKLFIETLAHPDLTAVVRGFPVLNDATMADAMQIGLHKVAKLMDNGSDAPSTLLDDCSPEFREAYQQADLIIAKGQGNLEGLMPEMDSRIFFLLMAKCDVMAEWLGVSKGSIVVYNPN